MRFALVASLNWGYRYGLNGVLNGLDYHGHTLVDVHYLYDIDVPEWYRASAAAAFDFEVKGYSVAEYMEKYPPPTDFVRRWKLLFYNYKLSIELADRYDAVMVADLDTLITGNLENYFKAVVDTNLIMLPHFYGSQGSHINESSPGPWLDQIGVDHHFAVNLNSPVIFDPRQNKEFLEAVWRHGEVTHSPYRAIFWALIELDKLKDCIVLPNLFWFNPLFTTLPYVYGQSNGKRAFFIHGDKVMMVHRRWWCPEEMLTIIDREVKTPEEREIAVRNMNYFVDECKQINTTWKLPLDWEPST